MKYDQQTNTYSFTKNELKDLTKIYKIAYKLQDMVHNLPYYNKDEHVNFDPIYEGLIKINESINSYADAHERLLDEYTIETKYYKNK